MTVVPTFADVTKAARRIAPHVHRTPVFTSAYLNELSGAEIFLKAENLQKIGAFKARGAVNAVVGLSNSDAARGVITHSSGNHGQAIAFACAIRGIHATVVMPDHAPKVKVDAVRGYGADIVFCPQSEREKKLQSLVETHDYSIVHPFDDPAVVAGQGTATLEFFEQVAGIDTMIVPIGGGGLLSGAAIVAAEHKIVPFGAEPEIVDDAYRSLRDGIRYPATGEVSVGDGLLTGIGEIAFAVLSQAGTPILRVSEAEILEAMRMLAERTKLVVEPSGAVGVAALVRYAARFSGRRVGVILSGGNIELSRFSDGC